MTSSDDRAVQRENPRPHPPGPVATAGTTATATATAATTPPPSSSRRLPALDVLRGIAILGTLLTNIWIFSTAGGGADIMG